MKNIWSRLMLIGISPGMDNQLSKRIKITNQVVASLSIIAFLYIFVFYFAGYKKEGLEVIPVVCAMATPIIFNYYRRFALGRVWFVVTINVVVLLYSFIFGRNVGIHLVFFPCACIPWMIFELRDMKYILAGTALSFVFFYIFYLSNGVPEVSITPDIEHFFYSSIVFVVFIMIGLCLYFFAFQNHKSEQFLQDTYKQFFEDIPTPMWIFNVETLRFLAVNQKAIQTYGFTRDEFLGMTLKDIRPDGHREEVTDIMRRRSGEKTFDAGYLVHRKKDGTLFYTHILSNSTTYNGIKARVAVSIDVNEKVLTEKKNEELNRTLKSANYELQVSKENLEAQEEELRQINEELTQQTEELKASEEELRTQEEELRHINKELEEKSETIELARIALVNKTEELEAASRYKSEFLANMSHELRTPLNSILILANLFKENKAGNLNAKQIEYAGIIHKSGSDLLTLINDILDLSKIEAGKVELFVEPVKVKEIAYDLEQLFTVLANERKINFAIEVHENTPELIATDRQRIEQVIKNLLSNAFKFTHAGGKVSLGFAKQDQFLAISVSDTGVGIPEEKQKLIFEAFQQADGSTSRRFGGTGLGLSISKELVSRLHGEIRLASAPGRGSIFTVYIPLEPRERITAAREPRPLAAYNAENVKQQTLLPDDKSKIRQGEQSLLIIEDDVVFANHVKEFAHSKGFKAIVAISGDEGIFYAKKFVPTAIILDLGLPVINGRNVLSILKSDKDLKHIPIHVMTADDRGDLPTDIIESYLRKPLNANDLDRAFADIELYIKEHYKNILVVSSENEGIGNMIETLTAEKNAEVVYDVARSNSDALEYLKHKSYDCIIADIDNDLKGGTLLLEELKKTAPTTYIITCLDADLSSGDEKLLKTYSNSIIRKSNYAGGRLMDEVELFLHKVNNPQKIDVPETFQRDFERVLAGKKVLLADDDMRNVFALTAILEEQEMIVIAAENGREAIELLNNNTDIDIVLMDIMMPEMDGYEAMRQIRASGKFKKLPIIALTAKAMTGDREKCIQSGASDYITKPVDSNKLFSLIRVWLS